MPLTFPFPVEGDNTWYDYATALDLVIRNELIPYSYTKRTITAAYTLVVTDYFGIVLHSTAATAINITLPSDATAAIPQEAPIPWRQYGAGAITFVAGSGATRQGRGSAFTSAGQYAEGVVTKVAANTWVVSGDLV